jgi:hypothetical protein
VPPVVGLYAAVRDVLRKAGAHDEPPIYPTIDAALAALAPGAGGFTHNG